MVGARTARRFDVHQKSHTIELDFLQSCAQAPWRSGATMAINFACTLGLNSSKIPNKYYFMQY